MTTVPEMRDPTVLARRRAATASFHDRMARAFRSVGREADAKAAESAAAKCREPRNGRP